MIDIMIIFVFIIIIICTLTIIVKIIRNQIKYICVYNIFRVDIVMCSDYASVESVALPINTVHCNVGRETDRQRRSVEEHFWPDWLLPNPDRTGRK